MPTSRIAHLLGAVSALTIVAFWFLVLTPYVHHLMPGEGVTAVAALAALAGSVFATLKGSRWWSIGLAGSLITAVVAIAFSRV